MIETHMKTIKQRLDQARQHLDDAEFIYREKIGNLQVMTKLYHAMIYSLFALFEIDDIGDMTHADLISRFERELVQNNTFNKPMYDALMKAYGFAHECDCRNLKQPTNGDIEGILPIVREFVENTQRFVANKRT
jgi:uncharacterized protein (UPF0332 family)